MNINLFKLALARLQPSDWEHFERLCSDFLCAELPGLRTMAAASGDGGRDSELFSPEGNPLVSIQYSVTHNWRNKIRKTAKRLAAKHPDAKILIYMSNQQIGGQADDLKKELLETGLMLDPRDINWFLERAITNAIRENAANLLIDAIARPYLVGEDVINKPTSPLTSGEAKAALVYLGLQWQDDITEKSLTKLSFDALVRAALRHTDSEKRMSRKIVQDAVAAALPSTERTALDHQVDKALTRLTKKYIRHWQIDDEFCLTHEESQRILSRLAEKEVEEGAFINVVEKRCADCLKEVEGRSEEDAIDLNQRVVRVLECLFLKSGEEFVTAVLSESLAHVGLSKMVDIIFNDISNIPPVSQIIEHYPKLIATIIQSLLLESAESTHLYLRKLANAYTLFSFLNQTPDVQSATQKLFSHGTIWADTTLILPLLSEQLEEDTSACRLTSIFKSCVKAGVELRVTTGIIHEVNAHMNNALMCSRRGTGSWLGRTPFLYSHYLQTGAAPYEFSKWLSLFRGSERPEEDLTQYLNDVFGIKRLDFDETDPEVDKKLRWALNRLWSEAHKERRRNIQHDDEATTEILIHNDVETYLGVVALRKKEEICELGYRHWLLTLDRNAWDIRDSLKEEFKNDTPPSPLLSLSFLINNMTFGPVRGQVGKDNELRLPLLLDIEMSEALAPDIIEIADSVRRDNNGLPEYVIRRKVRDAIDKARRRHGCLGYNGTRDPDKGKQE